jgi:hypothetical protein
MENSVWLTFVSSCTQVNAVVAGEENSAVIVQCLSDFVSPGTASYCIKSFHPPGLFP